MVEQTTEIVETFVAFYATLYTSRAHYTIVELDDYLYYIQLPRLSTEQVLLLEAPLMSKEMSAAIQSFPHNKTGLDGFPIEWYLQYREILFPHLLWVYNHALKEAQLPPSMSEALIVLIPKPHKDHLYCESYRPISLINSDVKILAKVLAHRLSEVITSIIQSDQTGFIPGPSTSINLRRLFTNIQAKHDNVGSRVVLALDTHKAFN